jgi:hypothetical protein
MRHDGEGSNRNNWLLIKQRDGHEREGDVPGTDQDRSVDRDAKYQPISQSLSNSSYPSGSGRLADELRV